MRIGDKMFELKFSVNDWLIPSSNFFRFTIKDARILQSDEELGVYLVKLYFGSYEDDGAIQVIDGDVLEKHMRLKNA